MNINREEKETGNEGKKTFHGTLTCLVNVRNAIRIGFYIKQLKTWWCFAVLV